MNILVDALLLFLPAGIANATPVFMNKVPGLNRWQTPMDFGRTFHGKRIFGDHKTWRGFMTGILCGILVGLILHKSGYRPDVASSLFVYLLFCAAIAAGTLVGDAVKSFFKRQVGVPSGSSWFPFDQLDFIIGSFVFMLPFGLPALDTMIAIVGLYFGGTLLSSYIGYHLGLKKKPI